MSPRRYELSDFEWSVIQPLLPNKPRGVPRADDRKVLPCATSRAAPAPPCLWSVPVRHRAQLGSGPSRGQQIPWRARQASLGWPLPAELNDDDRLEARLFPPPPDLRTDKRPKPAWAEVHRELRRADVTLALLWEEYKAREPDGFGYSRYVAAAVM